MIEGERGSLSSYFSEETNRVRNRLVEEKKMLADQEP
jgi:hypothetical protein